jgi:hypothetical protein
MRIDRKIGLRLTAAALALSTVVLEGGCGVRVTPFPPGRAFYTVDELDQYKLEELKGRSVSTQGEATLLASRKSTSQKGCLDYATLILKSFDSTSQVYVRVLPGDREACMTRAEVLGMEGRRLYAAGNIGIAETTPDRRRRLGVIASYDDIR